MRMRDRGDGYDWICTHVDDFKIVARDAQTWMDKLKGTFLIKSHGPRNYYLGNDYKFYDTFNIWTYGSKTYIKNALACIEQMFGCLGKVSTPLPVTDSHPELDDSPFLGLKNHRKFQMLLEMLQWLVTISRPVSSCLVATLNRFGACPRQLYRFWVPWMCARSSNSNRPQANAVPAYCT